MSSEIGKLIKLIHKLTEEQIKEVKEIVEEKIEDNKESEGENPECPNCEGGAERVVKHGKNGAKQRYRCRRCGKCFTETTASAMEWSRYGEAVWKTVIRGTLSGASLDATAVDLAITHVTSFNMRHKILALLEEAENLEPTVISGVCEVDDTYVLESVKGTKIPEGYHRKPRKHGAKASKRGVSDEYVSIMAGIGRNDGQLYAKTANRAKPNKEDVKTIFNGHIGDATLVLCDGDKGFNALSDIAEVSNVKNEEGTFFNINSVNGFHSFVKTRHNNIYRGVATKYLNRYNALFTLAYARDFDECVDWVYSLLADTSGDFKNTIRDVKHRNILDLGQLVN